MKNKSKRPNEEEKKVWTILKCMKVKPGMSGFKKRHDKVHASSRWRNSEVEKRTARRRVKEIDEIKELAMHALIKQRKRDQAQLSKNKYIIVQPTEEV
jgi:hypothetical protein